MYAKTMSEPPENLKPSRSGGRTRRKALFFVIFVEPDNIREVLDRGFVKTPKEPRDADVFKVPDFSYQ